MQKGILYGLLAMVVFFIITECILFPTGMLIMIGGDRFTVSYHMFTYMGITLLCGVIVTCTYLIINKMDTLINELRNNKEKTH